MTHEEELARVGLESINPKGEVVSNSFKASEICAHASELVGGDREATHGDKTQNHLNIATLWGAYLNVPITAHQAAMMMVLLKVARTKLGALNRDDYVDMAGYAGCAAEIAKGADEQYRRLCVVPEQRIASKI